MGTYDPDEGKETTPGTPTSKRGRKKTTGRKPPKNWLPPSARETDSENPDHIAVPLTAPQRDKIAAQCLSACLWHLERGPKTRKQLEKVMAKHNAPTDIIEETLTKLEEYNYVNDTTYAENYTRSRTEIHRKGTRAIRQELHLKGIEPDTIAEALEAVDEETELLNARALVEKKLRSTAHLDPMKRTQRLVSMLARKGYPGNIAYQVVREALNDEDLIPDHLDQP